jgi:NAD(P)H-dependent FMN reductase
METIRTEQELVVSIIVGSTRKNRFAEMPARWIAEHLDRQPGITPRILDLKDFQLPWFEEEISPARMGDTVYESEAVQRWTAAIGASDAFVIVSPEYNHGYPAVLKNALDYVYREWGRKPVGFVSYGGVNGARVIEQLRQVAVELEMVPIQRAVHLPLPPLVAHVSGGDVAVELAKEEQTATAMIGQLLWWGRTLKLARQADALAVV